MYKDIIIDTNILIDYFFDRYPFYEDADRVVAMCENGEINGCVTTSTIMDLFYIIRRLTHSKEKAIKVISDVQDIFKVYSVDNSDIQNSIKENVKDFEDTVIENCAIRNKCKYIITRNINDFENKKIKVISPFEFLNLKTSSN